MCGAFGIPTSAAVLAFLGAMGDIFLLQEAHLRDEEDAAALSPACGWGAPERWGRGDQVDGSSGLSPWTPQSRESVDWAAYEGAKERLRGLLEARAKALAFQAWLRELEEGERPTAYFFQAARARRGASAIAGLRRVDGTLAEGQAMLAVAESCHAELFSRRACDPAAEARLLACVSARLGAEEAQAMEADVTLEEVREALMGLRDGRAPGHDGLPKECYVAFWHLLGPDLLEVYRTLLKGGALSASMQKGVLVLLHKGGDRAELGNWRPLTLLTTDYKVLAKVATARLRRVMGGLVSQDQTCGVPGRSCSWNLILLRDVLDWVDERNLPLALVSIDQEKAFDRVQHGFLFGVLGRMGFGPRFIGWVRTLYAGAYSCVQVNGFLSGAVEQAGGVRQGCPLSPLLYVLFMEPFAELVRRDPGVDGVRLPGAAGEVLKIQQYVDDTTLFVSACPVAGSHPGPDRPLGRGTGSRLSLTGKVIVVRSVLLPLLLHLAYVFPVPARAKLALTRAVFRFLWGGRYEYVSRELMYAPVAGGGRGVPRVPLKLDVLYASFASKTVLERAPHKCFFLARFYLAGFFRHLVVLSHVAPRADVRSPAYGPRFS
ncbi:hypothetical protein AAFF_G00096550 [Aldrovandia affinis]|uniref:Reverse transcriptase domain-containing protein n=1 Tax=Aldrovandia affinis TaxID=143900 RepID=A0AAD7WCM6_9TELE|nr:hypothetical protein AAFF_G00096550 [Aldrovandia affinis]